MEEEWNNSGGISGSDSEFFSDDDVEQFDYSKNGKKLPRLRFVEDSDETNGNISEDDDLEGDEDLVEFEEDEVNDALRSGGHEALASTIFQSLDNIRNGIRNSRKQRKKASISTEGGEEEKTKDNEKGSIKIQESIFKGDDDSSFSLKIEEKKEDLVPKASGKVKKKKRRSKNYGKDLKQMQIIGKNDSSTNGSVENPLLCGATAKECIRVFLIFNPYSGRAQKTRERLRRYMSQYFGKEEIVEDINHYQHFSVDPLSSTAAKDSTEETSDSDSSIMSEESLHVKRKGKDRKKSKYKKNQKLNEEKVNNNIEEIEEKEEKEKEKEKEEKEEKEEEEEEEKDNKNSKKDKEEKKKKKREKKRKYCITFSH